MSNPRSGEKLEMVPESLVASASSVAGSIVPSSPEFKCNLTMSEILKKK